MRIVGLLQNMWVAPHQVARVSKNDPTSEARERMIEYALFAGCLTGRRLRQGLGADLCLVIKWQECSPVVTDHPSIVPSPDFFHLQRVMEKHKPDIVVCFSALGKATARAAAEEVGAKFIEAWHPACRRVKDTMEMLERVRSQIYEHTVSSPR